MSRLAHFFLTPSHRWDKHFEITALLYWTYCIGINWEREKRASCYLTFTRSGSCSPAAMWSWKESRWFPLTVLYRTRGLFLILKLTKNTRVCAWSCSIANLLCLDVLVIWRSSLRTLCKSDWHARRSVDWRMQLHNLFVLLGTTPSTNDRKLAWETQLLFWAAWLTHMRMGKEYLATSKQFKIIY